MGQERPTGEYSDIGGLDKQIQEVRSPGASVAQRCSSRASYLVASREAGSMAMQQFGRLSSGGFEQLAQDLRRLGPEPGPELRLGS